MTIFDSWPNQWFGLFKLPGDTFLQVPLFEEIIDANWSPPDFDRIVDYLDSCPIAVQTKPVEGKCHLCAEKVSNASIQYSDGYWVWPVSLSHYVRHHHVRLPDRMVADIRNANYTPKATTTTELHD